MATIEDGTHNKKRKHTNDFEILSKNEEEGSVTFKKKTPIQLYREAVESHTHTDVQIKIGEWTYDCHFMVLQCYSELFNRITFKEGMIIEIPEENVSSKTFTRIYKWMISDDPKVQRDEVIELLVAACYLEIEDLATQIWGCLNDEQLQGDAAYFLYMEANVLKVECVSKLMLERISKFFLTLVAFKEFLLMPLKDLCFLIGSDTIAVNTEIEVFMAALRWLGYDWMKRRKHIKVLMKKVRFCLMPPGYLIELDRNMIENSLIKRVMARARVRELVSHGLEYATTRLCYGKLIEENCIVTERHWIYDKNCEYHIQKNQLIEYKITFENFLNYLAFLRESEQYYWQSVSDIESDNPSSSRLSGKFEMPICEIMKETVSVCQVQEDPVPTVDISRFQEGKEGRRTKRKLRKKSESKEASDGKASEGNSRTTSQDVHKTPMQPTEENSIQTYISWLQSSTNEPMSQVRSEDPKLNQEVQATEKGNSSSTSEEDGNYDFQSLFSSVDQVENCKPMPKLKAIENGYSSSVTSTTTTSSKEYMNNDFHSLPLPSVNVVKGQKIQSNLQAIENKYSSKTSSTPTTSSKEYEHKSFHSQFCQVNIAEYPKTQPMLPIIENSSSVTSATTSSEECRNNGIPYTQKKTSDASCQYEIDTEWSSNPSKLSREEAPRIRVPSLHLESPSTDLSTSYTNSTDSAPNIQENYPLKYYSEKLQKKPELQKEEAYDSSDSSDTNSSVKKLSLDRLLKAYTKENNSYKMSVKSTLKKSVRIDSFENNKDIEASRANSPSVCERYSDMRHPKFDLRNIELEKALSNLSISSKPSSSRQSLSKVTPASIKEKEKQQVENYVGDGAGDAPILNTMEPAIKMLFNNKTLLILGGTDPFNQEVGKLKDFDDRILFYSNRFKNWAHLAHTSFGTRQHHEAVVCNGIVYIIGGTKVIPGCKNTYFETSIWALNTETKKWTLETNLPRNRRDFAVAAVGDELYEPGFYIIGGESFHGVPLDSVWFYNIARKVWLRKAPLNTPRYGFSAAIVRNEIWIAGGIAYDPDDVSSSHKESSSTRSYTDFITDTIETFKLDDALSRNKGNWVESKYRLRQRCLYGKLISTKDNQIFLIGGIGNYVLESFDSVDRFDLSAKKWIQCGKLQTGRHGHAVVMIEDYVAIIGGVSSTQEKALKSIEFFCTKTFRIFNPIPELPRSISGLAAVIVDGEW